MSIVDLHIMSGNVLQTLTRNAGFVIDGTMLLVIMYVHPADAGGRFLEGRYGGCSEPGQKPLYRAQFPPHVAARHPPAAIHL